MPRRPLVAGPPVHGLASTLRKGHKSSLLFSWGKRWFEVDDSLGVLLCFKTHWCSAPRHVYALSSFTAAEEEATHDQTTHTLVLIPAAGQSEDGSICQLEERLVLAADSKALQRRWVRGLQQRIACASASAPVARKVVIDVTKHASSRRPADATQTVPSGAEGNDGSGSARKQERLRVGVTVIDNPRSPIGSLIEYIQPGSPAEVCATAARNLPPSHMVLPPSPPSSPSCFLTQERGLKEGEVVVAVGGEACLSHAHCVQLLNAEPSSQIELIVSTPSALRECIEIG
jgi:hypothetical protein